MSERRFEVIKKEKRKYEGVEITLPRRATKTSAGYDFYAPADFTIKAKGSEIIWSDVKVKCGGDEYLLVATTSGMGRKGLIIASGIGVIDSDYYGNPNNDGNVGFSILNYSDEDYTIKKGEKLGQGIFTKYYTIDEESGDIGVRVGGFGSTVKKS